MAVATKLTNKSRRPGKVSEIVEENKVLERARVGQLAVIVIGESRAYAGEVTEIDNETGQILAAYITGGRMLRFTLGKPPTCGLLGDWTDKQTVFSLCPRNGWQSLMQARDVLQPLYREWLEKQKEETKANEKTTANEKTKTKTEQRTREKETGLTDEQRKAWLAKYSRPAK